MEITCPECATSYPADAADLAAGGKMICGACGAIWHQEPIAPPPPRPQPRSQPRSQPRAQARSRPLTPPADPRRMLQTVPPSPPSSAVRRSGARGRTDARRERSIPAALVLAVAGAVGAFAAVSITSMGQLPPPPPYTPIIEVGDGSTPTGLVFVAHGYDVVELPDGEALQVWGRVANNGPDEIVGPQIEITSRDAAETRLQRWSIRPESHVLAPGESARFATRMMNPVGPVAAVDLKIAGY